MTDLGAKIKRQRDVFIFLVPECARIIQEIKFVHIG
jgi:hypothetical protein